MYKFFITLLKKSNHNSTASTIQPVDNDPNDVLTIVIYGSRADYVTYQGFLYGLGTNNGGMYIEHWGKIFTYQRTSQESIYTLKNCLDMSMFISWLDAI